MADQWQVEPSGPGVLGRLLVPQSSTKPAVTAFLAGLAGAGAFVASLVLDWQKITVPTDLSESSSRSRATDEIVLTAGFGSVETLGLVYVLGTLGLLTILGFALVRPESALRMRMGAAGLSVGLLGVLAAAVVRLPETVFNALGVSGSLGGLNTNALQEMIDATTTAYEPGMFVAFAAVALLAVAVWLAGAPAARAAARWAAFAAAYPAQAADHSAQFPGAHPYPPLTAPNAPVVPPQTGNGAAPLGHPATATVPVGSPPAPAQSYPTPPPPYAPPPAPSAWSRPGHVDELTVMPSEPLDPGTNPDVWRG